MADNAQTVLAFAVARLGEVTNANACATFVSQVFKAAGAESAFTPSSGVARIVADFPSSRISNDLQTAMAGDLIVFGTNEHIMIYQGGGQVIGTGTGKSGVTTVVSVPIGAVTTDKGLGFSKVLHTDLYQLGAAGTGIETVGTTGQYSSAVEAVKQYFGRTYGDLSADPDVGSIFTIVMAQYHKAPTDVFGGFGSSVWDPEIIAAATAFDAKFPGLVQSGAPPDVLGLFGSMFAWVPGFMANGAVLLLIVVLAVMGIRQVLDSAEG